uniref:Fibronectin type-III domain-containing protein n=1 Tax=Brugia timori TaxID=42155 RepID=A0A0R3R6A4_9BILA
LSFNWIPGFDGGSEQIFEVRYQTSVESVYHIVNSSFPEVEIRGLQPACLYEISIRARNKRGMVSEFSRPPITVYTKDEYGMDVISATKVDIIFQKTEMVRNANNNGLDVRPVQMYGTLTCAESLCRPDSINTSRSELGHDPHSEDDQISPNGYVQQVDPVNYYEPECLVEYEFDPNLYGDVIKSNTLRRSLHNYVNLHHPKVSENGDTTFSFADRDSLSLVTDVDDVDSSRRIHKPRIIDVSSSTSLLANNNTTSQMLSTFLHHGGIHTTPFNFAHVDGDLV